jgi:hypothetical protein
MPHFRQATFINASSRLYYFLDLSPQKKLLVLTMLRAIDKQAQLVEDEIKTLVDNDKQLKHPVKLLLSIDGIGNKTAWAIIAWHIKRLPEFFMPHFRQATFINASSRLYYFLDLSPQKKLLVLRYQTAI